MARIVIRRGGAVIATVEPASRFYPVREMARAEAGILTLGFGQVYASIGTAPNDGSVDAKLFWKPLVTLIWIGALDHGAGRRNVALRPPPALRRRAPRSPRDSDWGAGGMSRIAAALCAGALMIAAIAPAHAVEPDEILTNPKLESRARALSADLRCLVCQNESIDDSHARTRPRHPHARAPAP